MRRWFKQILTLPKRNEGKMIEINHLLPKITGQIRVGGLPPHDPYLSHKDQVSRGVRSIHQARSLHRPPTLWANRLAIWWGLSAPFRTVLEA
jgi:hypothetical protein